MTEGPGADSGSAVEDAEQRPPVGRFVMAVVVAGLLALFAGFLAWSSEVAAGLLICLGALAKVISIVIGSASKARELHSMKSWIEERLGYFDAIAGVAAFPALFAVGAKLAAPFFESF